MRRATEASAAVVRRFQQRAYGLARTVVADPGTAEEVAQEAFVRAWRYAGSYDARRGTVLTWLLRIVRNVAVDRLRLRQPEPLDPEVLASELVDRRGRRITLASFRLADGAWDGSIPVDLRDVAAVHLVGGDGRSVLVGEL